MEVKAIARNQRISASKGRDLARAVQGKILGAALRSAAANASHNFGLDADALSVRKAVFDEGPSMRRYWPRARGSASPIEKQTSHVTVVLTDEK